MIKRIHLFLLVFTIFLPLTTAMASKTDLRPLLKEDSILDLTLGKAEVVDIEKTFSDVLVADPTVIDVVAVQSNKLYIVGARLGDTNIIILDEFGEIIDRMNVHVKLDTKRIQAMISELYPDEDVNVRSLNGQVVLNGRVSTPSVSNMIANLVSQYVAEAQEIEAESADQVVTNMLAVQGEQQVMLRVKIVEASRTGLKDLGVETSFGQGISGTDQLGVMGTQLFTSPALGLTRPVQLGTLQLFPWNFLTTIRALEEKGSANTLAEPNLTAISGEQAGFLAGGEFPIPTQIDQQGNLVYEFRPFGVSLNFRPVVLSENRISMQLNTEVSTATFEEGLQLNTLNVPTFNVRRAETTVELPSGGTLMIAGLLQSETVSSLTQIPGIGNIPVLGDLAKSDSFTRDETELIVLVTPYIVSAFADNNTASAERLQMPPQRNENFIQRIFASNLKRTYGEKAPQELMRSIGTFGYIMD